MMMSSGDWVGGKVVSGVTPGKRSAISAWFSTEDGRKGRIQVGQYADLTALSDDYFSVPEAVIKDITSVMTIVGGRIAYDA